MIRWGHMPLKTGNSISTDEIRGRYETLHEDLLYTSNSQCFEKAIQTFEFISHLFASIGE